MNSIQFKHIAFCVSISLFMHSGLFFFDTTSEFQPSEQIKEKVLRLQLTNLDSQKNQHEELADIQIVKPETAPVIQREYKPARAEEVLSLDQMMKPIAPRQITRPTVIIKPPAITEPAPSVNPEEVPNNLTLEHALDVKIPEKIEILKTRTIPKTSETFKPEIRTEVKELSQTDIVSLDTVVTETVRLQQTVLPVIESLPLNNPSDLPTEQMVVTEQTLQAYRAETINTIEPLTSVRRPDTESSDLLNQETPSVTQQNYIVANNSIEVIPPTVTIQPQPEQKDEQVNVNSRDPADANNLSPDPIQKAIEEEAITSSLHDAINARAQRNIPDRVRKRGIQGRVYLEFKLGPTGELLEIIISDESTESDVLRRAAREAVEKEAPFEQFALFDNEGPRWFKVRVNYIRDRSN